MQNFKSEFLKTIYNRGFIHQCTDIEALDDLLISHKPLTAYIGFDCTADSLHVGSLIPIMLLRWFQKTGHKPIVLIGGGTTKIGDPSGKDESRLILTDTQILKNMDGIKEVFNKFLEIGNEQTNATIVNNQNWLDNLSYISFLRKIGRHFSVNRMLSFESVKLRLEREQPLSFLEFNYMVLQGYDFIELSSRFDCTLQMGGSDQWGNIVCGIELARRLQRKNLYGLTSPLITTASGAKMGKTNDGAVWLNDDKVPSYDYYQFWRNTEDKDVARFLKLFTEIDLKEIAELAMLKGSEINEAKKILAFEATKLCHGAEKAKQASETSHSTFERGGFGSQLPTIFLPKEDLDNGISAFEFIALIDSVTSKGEARRLIRGGGVRINDVVITDESKPIGTYNLNKQNFIKVSIGKKRHTLIKTK